MKMLLASAVFLGSLIFAGCGQQQTGKKDPLLPEMVKALKKLPKGKRKLTKKLKGKHFPSTDAERFYSEHFYMLKPNLGNQADPEVVVQLIKDGKLTREEFERIQNEATRIWKYVP